MFLRKIISSQQVSIAMLLFCTALHISAAPAKKSVKASKSPTQSQLMKRFLTPSTAAHRLDWIKTGGGCNLCDGYFYQPPNLVQNKNPLPANQLPSSITSHGPASFKQNGMSELTGGVVVTQPGRRITADTAFVKRDPKSGKVILIILIGNVHLQQYKRLVVATYARMDLVKHSILLKNALYHLGPASGSEIGQKVKLHYDAWGYARYIHNPTQQIINLHNTTYTTCSPLNQVWMLSGRDMHLDRNRGIGKAKSIVLRFYKVPVAYFPYLRFPIDNRRLSGFLIPAFSHSTRQGTRIGAPIYWNMAPNYDMTITPYYNFERGFQITDYFRYLTKKSFGKLDLSYLPYDQEFKDYRRDSINQFAGLPGRSLFVEKLRTMHNYRAFAGFNGEVKWSDDWHTNYHFNYVTDPYYFRDVNTKVSFDNPNQLLNELDLQYQGEHWNFLSMVEGYQTLHRIDQFDQPIYDQYMRLPEFDTTAFYPSIWKNLNWNLSAQAVDFQFNGAFPTQTPNIPTPYGQRFHMRPGLSYDKVWSAGYIEPQIYLDATSYLSRFHTTTGGISRSSFDKTRVLPIMDLDAGLYFDRHFHFGKSAYIQTLEPRVFYLFVPYKNQDEYPNFDTQLLPFSYNQLFSLNRFAGFDRLDNANQMSFGLTSRILNSEDGAEKIRFDLGFIYYIQKPKVSLPGITLQQETVSPVVASFTYNINKAWSYNASTAYDFHNNRMNNAGTSVRYDGGDNRILSFGYNYVYDEDKDLVGQANSTNQIFGGISMPFYNRWTGFSYAEYNFSGKYPESYLAGLQYDSCCWALRFVFNRRFTGRDAASTPSHIMNQYDNVYYIQLQLKGLASAGNNSASTLLATRLPGYKDPFANSF
jgi:LPS-assembly protein